MKKLSCALLILFFLGSRLPGKASRTAYRLSLEAEYDCKEVPISTTLPAGRVTGQSVVLKTATGQIIPCQCEQSKEGTRVTWIVRNLRKGERRQYELVLTNQKAPTLRDVIKVERSNSLVGVRINGKPFMNYVFEGAPKPYCYPIHGPNGERVTRAFPMDMVPGEDTDHPHHRSLWFTHGDVNGVDFWGESSRAGKIVHRKFETLESGPVFGRIVALNDWVGPDGRKLCEDKREIRIYGTKSCRIMDIEITVYAKESPVKFGDTKEGTFGIRVASSMDADKGGRIINARGDRDGDAWGKQAEWCDYSGLVDGKLVGIAVFDHPSSFRSPTYWHVRTYGLFAANPFGLHDFKKDEKLDGSYTIPAGESITFRYRVLIHEGDAVSAGVAGAYLAYAKPPKVLIEN